MSEQEYQDYQPAENRLPLFAYIAGAVIAIFMVASCYTNYRLYSHIANLEQRQFVAEDIAQKSQAKVDAAQSSAIALAQRIGMTQKELTLRTREIQRQAKAAEDRLAREQQLQEQQLGTMSGDVAGVKTQVGGMKTDLSLARGDIEATKAKLDRTIGDLGLQSGLIAHTKDELELLKHRGDRNYYEFTLNRKKRTPVSTVSLQLKKTDPKHGRYTLIVMADDKPIEKKDRTMNEPVQFYTGRDHFLYELVVNSVEKNRVIGYLATPKGAPVPLTP
ncbi:MAG TPA: hypothetical protein VFZ99_07515 [Terriglobales bacterium]